MAIDYTGGDAEILSVLENASLTAYYGINRKIDHFKNYVYYMNENGFLKCIELTVHRTSTGSLLYYCRFTEPSFILGVFVEGTITEIPRHSLSLLTVKEIAFQTFDYFRETWIEKEDFRKVDSLFAFGNTYYTA